MSRSLVVVVVAVVVAATTALAHFALVAPTPGRGFNEDTETTPDCGGFNAPGPRLAFSPTSSRVHLEIYDGAGNVTLFWGNGTAPATYVLIPGTLQPVNSDGNPSSYAIDVPLNALNVSAGVDGTVQVVYVSDEVFYQCQDVSVVDVVPTETAAPTSTPGPAGSPLSTGQLVGIMAGFFVVSVALSVALTLYIVNKRKSYAPLA